MKKYLTISLLMLMSCSVAFSAPPRVTTYQNRNGSVQFRATEYSNGRIQTNDSRGTLSGTYQRSNNSIRETGSGFSSQKPNSSFSGSRRK